MNPSLSGWLQGILYIAAGINHFWHPGLYYRIIPPYFPSRPFINSASGVIEIVLGALLLFQATKTMSACAIIVMLIAFIPAHIYLIQISRCSKAGFCWPRFLAWIRLLPGQLLLIGWAYYQTRGRA